jgi:arginase
MGGDCSITMGAVAGLLHDGGDLTLLYMDGGPDLYTPHTRLNGNFDAMGVEHLLRLPGHVPELAPVPMIPDRVVSYGQRMPAEDHESVLLQQLGIAGVHAREVGRGSGPAAARALALVAAPRFLLHFDVDVLDFALAPIADVPQSGDEPGDGLTPEAMTASLRVFAADPRLAAVVLTEVNPDHAPGPATLETFVEQVTAALLEPLC